MKIIQFTPQHGINGKSHRREKHFKEEVSVILKTDKGFEVPVTIRSYRTPTVISFCMWLPSASGSGKSVGSGTAMFQAITSSGIKIEYGSQVIYSEKSSYQLMTDVAQAIADYLECPPENYYIHYAHA